MARIISVQPGVIGWEVKSPVAETPQVFLSGAKAEATAKSLAERLARQGGVTELHIYLKDGQLAGRFLCAPMVKLPLG